MNEDFYERLWQASKEGDRETVDLCLKHVTDVDREEREGLECDHISCVQL